MRIFRVAVLHLNEEVTSEHFFISFEQALLFYARTSPGKRTVPFLYPFDNTFKLPYNTMCSASPAVNDDWFIEELEAEG